MNKESFSSGEQISDDNTEFGQTEYLSFEDHQEQIRHNTEFNNMRSMKHYEREEGMVFVDTGSTDNMIDKIQNNEKLNSKDIVWFASEHGYLPSSAEGSEKFMKFLEDLGIKDGVDFDAKWGGTVYGSNGKEIERPFKVSFKNSDGSFTEIDMYRGIKKPGTQHGNASRGPQETYDISYIDTTRVVRTPDKLGTFAYYAAEPGKETEFHIDK